MFRCSSASLGGGRTLIISISPNRPNRVEKRDRGVLVPIECPGAPHVFYRKIALEAFKGPTLSQEGGALVKDIAAIPDVPVGTRSRLSRMCVGRCAS